MRLHAYHLASMVCQVVLLESRFCHGVRIAQVILEIKWEEARLGRGSHQMMMSLCQFVTVQQDGPGPRLSLEES